jgi:transposase
MSKKELSRYGIMEKTEIKAMSQKEAAELLGVSERHYRRLLKRYRENGVEGLTSKKRGKPSNRRYPDKLKQKTLKLLQGKYRDFGPAFASQKLEEHEQIKLSRETLRLWMIEAGLWKGKKQKPIKVHQTRIRRS